MLARAHAFTIDGLCTHHVSVEVEVRAGLPAFAIVGLADAAVREARERIRAAIRNSGYEFPARRITANLAPGGLPKAGPGLDLALACAVLAASGQLPPEQLERVALHGELGLDGSVRPSHGSFAIAHATHEAGLESLLLAPAAAREAQLLDGVRVRAVERLASATRVLQGGRADRIPPDERSIQNEGAHTGADLADVLGQHDAVRALLIAAAGGHNCLLSGAPGTGKTMLAQRLPGILPALTAAEAVEVTRTQTLTGVAPSTLERGRPFRAPHHSITPAGLLGGAANGSIGEVMLAHNGVLFLDELTEFSRSTLEALRQPLEDGRVSIARANRSSVHPTRFMLLAATNPCPCGYADELEHCSCTDADLARHRRRLSGPLLDRIDLGVTLHRPRSSAEAPAPLLSSGRARDLVRHARERQARRLAGSGALVNAHIDVGLLRDHARLDDAGQEMLACARAGGLLSTRGEHRVLRVARTVADLAGSDVVRAQDVRMALSLRAELTGRL